ncbi:MAG TPA: 16S rRNA (cytosine(967)-C(5))-methyltransferase RsmB, partial [Steroidobacteraceae bacterium]|nr:16S rRNA (cytosine(967)-C(5))-methyltransferase RsmB [Steroidobacteraceae bacterium]
MPEVRKRQRSRFAPGAEALAVAAQAVAAVALQGHSAEQALQAADAVADRAAARAIALGTLRWYLRLAPAVETLVRRPAQSLAPEVRALLVAAAHQIEYSRNPPELAVNAAVDAARVLRHPHASGFVNAVLRRFVTERGAILARLDGDRAARTAHPRWLVEALDQAWPEHADQVLDANNAHPPLVLRVDLTRHGVAACVRELAEAGLAARPLEWLATGVVLNEPVPVARIPGFADGRVSVQDAGAQLAAPALAARPGMRVLDACAAPGGKTGHLLEHTPGIELTAVDIDAKRLVRVQENLQRLRRDARLVPGDVRFPASFWDGRPFDRILLDAPCSSSGVIRRHPDIKLLRRASDIGALAATQLEMLAAAFGMLVPGGRLVYVT